MKREKYEQRKAFAGDKQPSMHHVASKDTACCMVGGGRWEPDLTGGVNDHN